MKRGLHWPVALIAVLIFSSAGQIWFAVTASRDKAFAVEGNYYDKAVHWNDELAQRRTNSRLGWKLSPTLRLWTANGDGSLEVDVRDAAGFALEGASVQVLAMHNARADRQLSAKLAEVGAGVYRAPVLAQRPGEWELRFTVTRGSERFTATERVGVAGKR
jgi:nitrogen fixation protein FixH